MNSTMCVGPSFQSKNIRILIPGEKELIHDFNDEQGALIKLVSNGIVKDGAQGEPINSKNSQIFSTLIELLTGKKLPKIGEKKSIYDKFL